MPHLASCLHGKSPKNRRQPTGEQLARRKQGQTYTCRPPRWLLWTSTARLTWGPTSPLSPLRPDRLSPEPDNWNPGRSSQAPCGRKQPGAVRNPNRVHESTLLRLAYGLGVPPEVLAAPEPGWDSCSAVEPLKEAEILGRLANTDAILSASPSLSCLSCRMNWIGWQLIEECRASGIERRNDAQAHRVAAGHVRPTPDGSPGQGLRPAGCRPRTGPGAGSHPGKTRMARPRLHEDGSEAGPRPASRCSPTRNGRSWTA